MTRLAFGVWVGFLTTITAAPAWAGDYLRNAWGVYAAPTTYETIDSGDYNNGPSNTSLDVGFYYSRIFTPRFSLRLEVRSTRRAMDVLIPRAQPRATTYYNIYDRIDENQLEVPLVLQADTRVLLGERELRVSAGGGLCYGVLLYQKHYDPPTSQSWTVHESGFGDYQRLSFLLDGGATIESLARSALFVRLRLQWDGYSFGATDDVVVLEYFAYGFCAGFEWGF
jgi:hypothetical protein